MDFASIWSNLLAPVYSNTMNGTRMVINIILIALMGISALAAIVLVMLTPGNSQGIDALGGSSETFYGKNKGKSTESKLKLATVICLVILGVFSLVFFILQIPAIWGA